MMAVYSSLFCPVPQLLQAASQNGAGPLAGNSERSSLVCGRGMGHMFQALFKKRATNRAYKRAVDDCLSVLFRDFPNGLLPTLRRHVDISGLTRRGRRKEPTFATAPCKWWFSLLGTSSAR
jgi:hypothetical protein